MTDTMTTPAPAEQALASNATLATGAAIGAGLALLATLVVYLIGAAGAPIRVVTGWQPDGADLTLVEVVIEEDRVWVYYPLSFDRPLRLSAAEALALLATGQVVLQSPGADAEPGRIRSLIGRWSPCVDERARPADHDLGRRGSTRWVPA